MVTHNETDVTRQLPTLMTPQQIVQAVIVLRHEDRDLGHVRTVRQRVGHVEARRDFGDALLEGCLVGDELRRVELDALKELNRALVTVLVGAQDVPAMAVKRLGQTRYQAAPIGA